MKKIWLGGALALVLAGGAVGWTQFGRAASATSSASQAATQTVTTSSAHVAALSFTDINGKRISVNPNEKTVLHFMTSSCSSCLPTETTLAGFQHMPGVQLISIDVEPQADNRSTIVQFSQVAGSHWPYVLETNSSLIQRFHVTELDTVIVLYHNHVIFDGVVPSASQLQKVLT